MNNSLNNNQKGESIMEHINKKRLIETFKELASIPSPSGQEEKIAQVLTEKLEKLDLVVQKDAYGNLVAKLDGEGESIMLCAHMDTVAVGGDVINVVDEDKGEIKSDGTTILGADNKDSIAAIIEMLAVIKGNNLTHRPVEIVLTREEEIISKGAKNLDFSLVSGKECIISDQAESYGTITLSAPYNYKFNIIISGKRCHSKEPEKGVDVIKILARAIEVENMPLGRIDDNTTSNIAYQYSGLSGEVNGEGVTVADIISKGRNSIPDLGVVHGEVRSLEKSSLESILKAIENAFANAADYFGGKINFTVEKLADGYVYNKSDPFVLMIVSIFKEQGIEVKFFHSIGGSDANLLMEYGIRAIVISSAHRNNHQKSEYLIVDDLVKLADFYIKLVQFSP
ncbi:MAG: hypothetical protein A3J63_02240 [Candidatus Moranbacteria bacterium RIFCSPHIGHO2_02_FULL_40_12b]|nr:MAG: hypothetical protein A3J63_02240 [Candidatus Moranbacteria bacterium RIFCSPHIGHO2_02_FULL_40_12b]